MTHAGPLTAGKESKRKLKKHKIHTKKKQWMDSKASRDIRLHHEESLLKMTKENSYLKASNLDMRGIRTSSHLNLSNQHFDFPTAPGDLKYGKLKLPSFSHGGYCKTGAVGNTGRNAIPIKPRYDKLLDRERQQNLRKGLFAAEELVDYTAKEYPLVDLQCVIRFPFDVAETLRQRQLDNVSLGLSITPTPHYDYRLFVIKITGISNPLTGILMELPNIIESYKTIDGDLMFKSGDISQMIYVYNSSQEQVHIETLRDVHHWEFKSGLTPPTHRIRTRKFKNFTVFDKEEIRSAELEVLELLNGLTRDSYDYVDQTEYDMLMHRKKFHEEEAAERVISATDDLQEILKGYESDASDAMFGLPHTPWVKLVDYPALPLRTAVSGGLPRIGRPRRRGMGSRFSSKPRLFYGEKVRSGDGRDRGRNIAAVDGVTHYLPEYHGYGGINTSSELHGQRNDNLAKLQMEHGGQGPREHSYYQLGPAVDSSRLLEKRQSREEKQRRQMLKREKKRAKKERRLEGKDTQIRGERHAM